MENDGGARAMAGCGRDCGPSTLTILPVGFGSEASSPVNFQRCATRFPLDLFTRFLSLCCFFLFFTLLAEGNEIVNEIAERN